MNKRSTSNKCNHNKATIKKKPYRYSIADRVLQRCIKLNHITPFDCVTDEAPHRQIPYERRPFRGVRVFQISQDSLDYFLVARLRSHTLLSKNPIHFSNGGMSKNSMFQCSKENVSRRQREINYTKNLALIYLY